MSLDVCYDGIFFFKNEKDKFDFASIKATNSLNKWHFFRMMPNTVIHKALFLDLEIYMK